MPATLHTCREARSLGLYQPAFSELSPADPSRYVWLNLDILDIDTVSIDKTHSISFATVAHLVKRLRLERANHEES